MPPSSWTEVHRPADGELVGYLTVDGRGTTPLTLFGYPLAAPTSRSAAEELLCRRGLAVLAEPWWLANDPADSADGSGFRVQIMSATPDAVMVARADHGIVDPYGELLRLRVPAAGLRPHAP